jgi:hypothetical protein
VGEDGSGIDIERIFMGQNLLWGREGGEETGRMIANIDPRSLISELASRHVHDLDHREQTLLLYLYLGYDVKDIAARMERAEPTIYRWLGELEHRVLDFTPLPACLSLLRAWASLQLECCPRVMREMIEDSRAV